jgi:hypothetical protein
LFVAVRAAKGGSTVETHADNHLLCGGVEFDMGNAPRLRDAEDLGVEVGVTHAPNLRTAHTIY